MALSTIAIHSGCPPVQGREGQEAGDGHGPELELQELCADATESEELDELWASLLVFITLFLLSVSYGATSTLFKVKWVLATVLQEKPQAARDYANIVRPAQLPVPTMPTESKTSPSVFPLSLSRQESEGYVVIGCLVQGFFPPEPVNVTWNAGKDSTSVKNFPPVKAATGSLYTMSSQLTLPASQCPADSSVKCQVQHASSPSTAVSVPCKGSNASLTCTLSGLKDPKGATFTWNPSNGKKPIQKTPERDSCGCYSVSSVLPGCSDPWNRGDTFSCTATHPESKSPITVSITKPIENIFPPQVHLLPPPSEELALNELVTLTCLVRGFNPKDVLVRWLRGTQELPQEKYLTWEPLKEPDQTNMFAVTSMLRVTAEDWKQGEKFSCMVGHEALPLSFTQKTIDRLAGKPTHVNVSVVMAEVDGICY
ncbi:unnamed protein product [Nyctereutes procyonoides]|uniref:(raccoon dog) hypothetical protein n=1 Tax=Nyctereutes procyonoides TaxID=34880 RepID=A0A811YPY6_NYCPR|nr:unnamed protein product [Nyctereutes procyonoides]